MLLKLIIQLEKVNIKLSNQPIASAFLILIF